MRRSLSLTLLLCSVLARAEFLERRLAGVPLQLFHAQAQATRFFWRDPQGQNWGSLARLNRALRSQGTPPVLLMNASIFNRAQQPAGLWIEQGQQLRPLNRKRGRGNFHLPPAGIFWIQGRRAGITPLAQWRPIRVRAALQSGPMLVHRGRIPPTVARAQGGHYRRNGVCIARRGLYFVLTPAELTLAQFARALKDFGCREALYFDGSLSQWLRAGQPEDFHWRSLVGIIAVMEQPYE